MNIFIPKQISFDVPEGNYRVALSAVIELNGKVKQCDQQVRLQFEVIYPLSKTVTYRLGKNYCADTANCLDLIEDLRSWLGDDLINLQSEDGRLDLLKLKSRQADVVVEHRPPTEQHGKPFVRIKEIHPPGTLVKIANN